MKPTFQHITPTKLGLAAAAMLALPALSSHAVDHTGFNTEVSGFANDLTGGFNTVFDGAFNAVRGSHNTLGGGGWNMITGYKNVGGPNGYWNFIGGSHNTATSAYNLLWGKGLHDGAMPGSVILADSDPFGLRIPPDPAPANQFVNTVPYSLTGIFSNGYSLYTDDGQGANADNGLFVASYLPNTPIVTYSAFLGINNDNPNDVIDATRTGNGRVGMRATGSGQSWFVGHEGATGDFTIRDLTDGSLTALNIEDGTQFVGLAGENNPNYPLEVGTNATNGNGAHVTIGGTWVNGSSREFKKEFRNVDSREVLRKVADLPVQTWRYKNSEEGVHMGPIAEEFHESFGLGGNEQYIATVDIDGVALAAIKGLNEVVEEKETKIAELEASHEELENRLEKLEALLETAAN